MNSKDIIEIRTKMGMTQDEFAIVLGVSKNTVYNYEKGTKIPDSKIPILNKLANEKITILSEPKEEYNLTDNKKGVPYYDVDFTAGFLEAINDQNVNPDSYISHPFFKGCDYVVRASGQSMAKVISHGDAIGLIKIENWREFFPFGEIYALVTKDGFRMVKIITKGENEDYYTLISKPTDNKKDEFPPQQIKKSTITQIFKVQASSHLF